MSLADRLYRSGAKLAWWVAPVAWHGDGKVARGLRDRRDAARRLIDWARTERDPARPLVWIHAPSVGEGQQARAVLEALRARRPELQAVFTYFSPSAESFAARVPAGYAGPLPWDVYAEAGRAVMALRPTVLVFTKTELWPVLAAAARTSGARTALVAATLPRGSSRLRWPTRAIVRSTIGALDLVAAVGEADARRYRDLGAADGAIHVAGDPAVDSANDRVCSADSNAPFLRPFLAAPASTVVAGSTWPSDEEVLVPASVALRARVPALRLIVAPHEPTLGAVRALERRLAAAGWRTARLGEVEARGAVAPAEAVVVDRVGVLAPLYTLGDAAWVGGGFHGAGLHSVLEPAAAGMPAVFGPRHATVPAAAELAAAGAAREVTSADNAAAALGAWLADARARASATAAARRYIEDRLGASERTAELVSRLVARRGSRAPDSDRSLPSGTPIAGGIPDGHAEEASRTMQTGGSQPPAVPEITPTELKERLDRKDSIVLVDVREPHECAIADLPDMGEKLRIPLRELPARADELDPKSELVLYCRSGARSGRAAAALLGQGFTRVWNLKGGVLKWREDVDPSLKAY